MPQLAENQAYPKNKQYASQKIIKLSAYGTIIR